jgi:hypothetical protein
MRRWALLRDGSKRQKRMLAKRGVLEWRLGREGGKREEREGMTREREGMLGVKRGKGKMEKEREGVGG